MGNRTSSLTPGLSEPDLRSQLAIVERVVAFISARNRLSATDAEDFGSHVTLKLLEDDHAILRKFEGRSNLRTYLTVVIQRLFLDYRTSAWGKWRPSAEAKRKGAIAILIERLLTRDGYSLDEAFEVLITNHRLDITRGEVEQLVGRLPARVRRRFEGDETLAVVPGSGLSPEEALAEQAREASESRVTALLKRAIADFAAHDQLLLTMRYEDGRTVAEIASVLREDQKGLYRRFDRLLRELRARLESQGVDVREVTEMLDTQLVQRSFAEEINTRPSIPTGARK